MKDGYEVLSSGLARKCPVLTVTVEKQPQSGLGALGPDLAMKWAPAVLRVPSSSAPLCLIMVSGGSAAVPESPRTSSTLVPWASVSSEASQKTRAIVFSPGLKVSPSRGAAVLEPSSRAGPHSVVRRP